MKTTNYYVLYSKYTSTDWHDMASIVTQMKQGGHYEIENPEEFIAKDIFEHTKELNPSLTLEDIKMAMNAPDDGYFRIDDDSRIEIFSKNHSGLGYKLHYDCIDYTFLKQYFIEEIKKENVAYCVSEHIVNPGKGRDLLERLSHDLFYDLTEAEKYQEEMMKDYKHEGCTHHKESGYKISVVDKTFIKKTDWYKDNMLVQRLLEEAKEKAEDYFFYPAYYAVSLLQQKIYDAATKEEKLAIDWMVYRRVFEYLQCWQTDLLDAEMEKAEKDDSVSSRDVADKAIIFAFINADSQIAYDIIHQKLGEYVCRIAQITEANAREKRGHGNVCISKTGEIGYYDDAFGINRWDGAKDNPYFRKFSYNMGGEVEQFKDFKNHHMFVDELPSQELVDSYEQKYNEWEKTKKPFS